VSVSLTFEIEKSVVHNYKNDVKKKKIEKKEKINPRLATWYSKAIR
jgi:hypothetical protein